jgi:hypothetical protein
MLLISPAAGGTPVLEASTHQQCNVHCALGWIRSQQRHLVQVGGTTDTQNTYQQLKIHMHHPNAACASPDSTAGARKILKQ